MTETIFHTNGTFQVELKKHSANADALELECHFKDITEKKSKRKIEMMIFNSHRFQNEDK